MEKKIKFYAYSTVSNGHRFWLRNEVVSKANSSEALSSLLGVISNYNVDSVWIEDSLYLYAICPNFEDVISLTNSIYESGFVFFSEPDYYFDYEDHYNDPLYNEQFYLHNTGQIISSVCNEVCSAGIDLKVELAWNFMSHILPLYIPKIAVVDDGVEDHEDLYVDNVSKVWNGFPAFNHGRPLNGHAHGQCCAGIIAATPNNNKGIVGVSPNSWIIPIRIQKKPQNGEANYMKNTRIARGIKKSWSQFSSDILNNSWGSTGLSSDVIIDAYVRAATEGRGGKGCVVVASSGNDYSSTNINFIGNINQVIAVGGIKGNGIRGEYSNYSSSLNIVAIGGGVCYVQTNGEYYPKGTIRTIDREGSHGYANGNYYEHFGMTSAAAPQVSGVAALMLSVNPNLTSAQVKTIIEQTAYKLPDYNFDANGWNQEVGYGLVDAHKAVVHAYEYDYDKQISGLDELSSCGMVTYTCDILSPELFTYQWTVSPHLFIISNEGNSISIVPQNQGNATISVNVFSENRLMFTFTKTVFVTTTNMYWGIVTTPIISENTTWGGSRFLPFSLTIDSTKTLTITGTLHCSPGSSIIVRPGGKLVVNGGTLTNACDGEMWQGIIVEGNANIRQAALAQGSVILTNATIENARDAISTRGADNNAVFEHTGGIIQATNTLFRNNRRSVEFLSYENHTTGGAVMDNVSYFTRCTFTVDNDNLFAANDVTFKNHVSMWHVRGVKFNGCTFRNETGSHSGKAIYTDEAGFIARRVCPQVSNSDPCVCNAYGNDTVTRCSFSGFHTAVHSTNGHASYAVTLDNCDFSDNHIGVELAAADNARVSFCDFDLSAPASLYGLYLKNSTGYTVESNSLHSEPYTNSPSATGISVVHSGTAENVIRKNVFRNLMYGCLAQDTNGTSNYYKPQAGLQFQCNDFLDCSYDIAVANGRIRSMQGSASAGADNIFRYAIQGSFLLSNASPFTYWYSNTGYHAPYNSPTPGVTLKDTAAANSCASTLCGDIPLYPRGTAALSQYLSMAEEYAAIVETLRDVETCHGASLQTDATNPQDDTDDADLIGRLSDLSAQMGDLARSEIRNLLNDSVPDMALLRRWYATIVETVHAPSLPMADSTIPVAAYQLAETYSMEGDLAAAAALLASLPQQFIPDEAARNEYANYMALQQLRETVAGNWYAMTDTDIAAMQQVAEYDNGRAARMAKEILCFFHHICYEDEPLWDLDSIGERALRGDGACPGATTNDGTLRIHPNPTTHTLTVETASPIRTLTVYDLAGRVMMTVEGGTVETCHGASLQVDVSSLPNGIYLLRAVTDNGVETGRFVKN